MLDKLKVLALYLLPTHLVSRVVHRFTRSRNKFLKNALTRWYIKHFKVNMELAAETDPYAYETFNEFFTRELRSGARPLPDDENTIACPVDGCISQIGRIDSDRIFQAKGHDFSLTTLLGGNENMASLFLGGHYTTLYLSPRDYHRIHMPVNATLNEMIYVPGRLYGVFAAAVNTIPGIFSRNERVICQFSSDKGPVVMVLVGALNVGSIETTWHGEVTPPHRRNGQSWTYHNNPLYLDRGEEMGRFNMGSTVILIHAPDQIDWQEELAAGDKVVMGQAIGHYN